MSQTANVAAQKLAELLSSTDSGVNAVVSGLAADTGISLGAIRPAQILNQNVPFAIAEKSLAVKYPVVHVYSDRVRNQLTEKFRTFSGKVRTVAEVRVSQDRVEGIEDQLRLYVDGVTQVLDENRGDWGQGAFYTGGYEVSFDPVQHGGSNFLQVAKVSFEVDMSS